MGSSTNCRNGEFAIYERDELAVIAAAGRSKCVIVAIGALMFGGFCFGSFVFHVLRGCAALPCVHCRGRRALDMRRLKFATIAAAFCPAIFSATKHSMMLPALLR